MDEQENNLSVVLRPTQNVIVGHTYNIYVPYNPLAPEDVATHVECHIDASEIRKFDPDYDGKHIVFSAREYGGALNALSCISGPRNRPNEFIKVVHFDDFGMIRNIIEFIRLRESLNNLNVSLLEPVKVSLGLHEKYPCGYVQRI